MRDEEEAVAIETAKLPATLEQNAQCGWEAIQDARIRVLELVCRRMRASLPTQKRRSLGILYSNCLDAKCIVDWLVKSKFCANRKQAVEMGRMLQKQKFIEHIWGSHTKLAPFRDMSMLFRYTARANALPRTSFRGMASLRDASHPEDIVVDFPDEVTTKNHCEDEDETQKENRENPNTTEPEDFALEATMVCEDEDGMQKENKENANIMNPEELALQATMICEGNSEIQNESEENANTIKPEELELKVTTVCEDEDEIQEENKENANIIKPQELALQAMMLAKVKACENIDKMLAGRLRLLESDCSPGKFRRCGTCPSLARAAGRRATVSGTLRARCLRQEVLEEGDAGEEAVEYTNWELKALDTAVAKKKQERKKTVRLALALEDKEDADGEDEDDEKDEESTRVRKEDSLKLNQATSLAASSDDSGMEEELLMKGARHRRRTEILKAALEVERRAQDEELADLEDCRRDLVKRNSGFLRRGSSMLRADREIAKKRTLILEAALEVAEQFEQEETLSRVESGAPSPVSVVSSNIHELSFHTVEPRKEKVDLTSWRQGPDFRRPGILFVSGSTPGSTITSIFGLDLTAIESGLGSFPGTSSDEESPSSKRGKPGNLGKAASAPSSPTARLLEAREMPANFLSAC